MNAPRTLFDKLWEGHEIAVADDGQSLLAIDRIFLHERTGTLALKALKKAGRAIRHPQRAFCVMDHIVDTQPGRPALTRMPGGVEFITATREAAQEAGIRLFDIHDPRQGIVHVISPELGLALPGLTLVCPDSHTCTVGGLGALAWGIGTTQAEHALATGTLRAERPKTMRVLFTGTPGAAISAKDLILALIARHSVTGGLGHAVEFAGPAIEALGVEGRMTLCNMAIEFGAFTGMAAPDEKVFEFLKDREFSPKGELWKQAVAHWRELRSDGGARFDRELELDCAGLTPQVSWGTSPEHAVGIDAQVPEPQGAAGRREAMQRALDYMGLKPGQRMEELAIDAAFIGSCTNARLSDLRAAAAILEGRRVAENIRAICVPGSMAVRAAAEAEGLHRVFEAAGFEWQESGCAMCFYAGGDGFGGRRAVSSTNRNFENRQGPGARTHLASPATVAASAVRGRLADPRALTQAEARA
ncbi:MAG: 3-isopropylmalate dehydratase large subunit [Gammaproteobacteria bacterium]|nr:3-isopropylmalate dehydratase large subunit [Gammaproteobacteria bacterium]